jgi:hypothetical protein
MQTKVLLTILPTLNKDFWWSLQKSNMSTFIGKIGIFLYCAISLVNGDSLVAWATFMVWSPKSFYAPHPLSYWQWHHLGPHLQEDPSHSVHWLDDFIVV